MEKNPKFHVPLFPDSKYWDMFRFYINKYLKFKKIGKNIYFEIFMFVVLTANCAIIIAANIVTDPSATNTLDTMDDIILYFYIGECVIKSVGFGIEKYWEDDWNKFDFAMIVLSLSSNILY